MSLAADPFGGIPVIVSPHLPTGPPSPGEDGRRIVRHGLADVLEWLGEPVGPRPGEPTHSLIIGDLASPGGATVLCSQEYYDRLASKIVVIKGL